MFIARQPIFNKSMKSDTIELIPSDSLVIEVLENVKIDDVLIERLKYLKRKGYKIALDDFNRDIFSSQQANWLDVHRYADIIGIYPNYLFEGYLDALKWVADVLLTL